MLSWTDQLCLLIKEILANHTWTHIHRRFAHPHQFCAIRASQFQDVIAHKWHVPTCQSCILEAQWKIICIQGRRIVYFMIGLECCLQLASEITVYGFSQLLNPWCRNKQNLCYCLYVHLDWNPAQLYYCIMCHSLLIIICIVLGLNYSH